MFRKNQFDEFLICVYQDGMPLMTVNSWRANQMDLVGLFMDQKERDKQELAKKRSPQRPKHHPVAALDELGKFFSEEVGIFLGGEVATSCESFVFRMQGPGLFACEDWDSFISPLS